MFVYSLEGIGRCSWRIFEMFVYKAPKIVVWIIVQAHSVIRYKLLRLIQERCATYRWLLFVRFLHREFVRSSEKLYVSKPLNRYCPNDGTCAIMVLLSSCKTLASTTALCAFLHVCKPGEKTCCTECMRYLVLWIETTEDSLRPVGD